MQQRKPRDTAIDEKFAKFAAPDGLVATADFIPYSIRPGHHLGQQDIFKFVILKITTLAHDHQIENPESDTHLGVGSERPLQFPGSQKDRTGEQDISL